MQKMTMIWVVIALELFPDINPDKTLKLKTIKNLVNKFWKENIDDRMINQHLVSWHDRVRNPKNPKEGGSANRYLFRTKDGYNPHPKGNFRLYIEVDSKYDGKEKIGKTHPELKDISIPDKRISSKDLLDWYIEAYFPNH